MSVIPFPSPVLTKDDEIEIVRTVFSGGYYSCKLATNEEGLPCITLLNRERQIRGHVIKSHGYYAVLDSRGATVRKSRKLDEVLSILAG
ncbi:MAG: hypothetical protein H6905_07880 [Hyphomicrobiales bacterium]|nr:hypothetical protein [Hyphomicrobiales bacterium]